MSAEIATALITASSGIILAGASYWFTKHQERDAELRKEKLQYYKAFALSLSGIITGESTPESQRAFSCASNNLILIAPYQVLQVLWEYRQETHMSNPTRSQERHDLLLSKLFLEIRKDLGVLPKDDADSFKIALWSSGYPTDGT